MRIWLVVIALGGGVAFADKPKLSADQQKQYKALLKDGRVLQGKKQYAAALKKFDDALAVAKDDATVLTEMGWTAYLAKDYDKAEAYTKRALAAEAAPNIRGAALYNLGLVEEKRGDRAGAIASYTESLKSRWNATVRGALRKLDPAAAAALDPFKPQAMTGPFASIDAYCKPKRTKPTEDDPETCECARDDKPAIAARKPFEALDWVKRTCRLGDTDRITTWYDVAAKVGGRWFVSGLAELDANFHCDDEVTAQAVTFEHGRAVFRLAEKGGCMRGGGGSDFTEDQLAVVGVGASGTPSATPAIVVERSEEEYEVTEDADAGKATTSVDVKLDVTWTDDGLALKGKTKGGDASLVGTHALAFP